MEKNGQGRAKQYLRNKWGGGGGGGVKGSEHDSVPRSRGSGDMTRFLMLISRITYIVFIWTSGV